MRSAHGNQSLPILTLKTPEQRYSCRSCGRCCRHFTVQLREEDITRLDEQGWYQTLGELPYHEFRGRTYLKQRDDGSCIFLQDDGLCRVHAEFGYTKKPIACQLFPFTLMPAGHDDAIQIGLSYACPSVIENHGASLETHWSDVRRMARAVPELIPDDNREKKSLTLTRGRDASATEVRIISNGFDRWLSRVDLPMHDRLLGAIIITAALEDAAAQGYLEHDFDDVFDLAFQQLEDELPDLEPDVPSAKQMKQLRQIVYAHVEDPKIADVRETGVQRKAFEQLKTNTTFSRGKGAVPVAVDEDWPRDLTFDMPNGVRPATEAEERARIDFLLMRYVRSRILGGRAFGPGYYNYSIVKGLNALWSMVSATGWLARLHAGAHRRDQLTFEDVEKALLRTDRNAGRAPWLGAAGERMRDTYLSTDNGYLRLLHAMRMTEEV